MDSNPMNRLNRLTAAVLLPCLFLTSAGATFAQAAASPNPCQRYSQLSFLKAREAESFGTIDEFRRAAENWDRQFWQTISAKDRAKPKSLSYSIPFWLRHKYLEHAYIGRNHYLDELNRLRQQSGGFGRDVTADVAIQSLVDRVVDSFPKFPIAAQRQDKAALLVRSQMAAFEKASGFPAIRVKALGDAIEEYYGRMAELRKVYGTEFLTDQVVNDAAFNAIGAHLFTEMAELPLHDRQALDAIALLDPLTDDALDRGLPVGKTMAKITEILKGNPQKAENAYEKIVFDLIDRIFKAHPPDKDPDVRSALQLIHEVQLKAVRAQKDPKTPLEEIAKLTSRKGGLSVWLAAKIATGRLSRKESEYFYKMGANAQMLDDLVDFGEDLRGKSQTLWTRSGRSKVSQPFQMLMRSQAELERSAPELLKDMANAEQLQNAVNLGTKLYLMGAVIQDDIGPALISMMRDKFPASRDNLRRAIMASMAKLDIPGDQRLQIIKILDSSLFNGLYARSKAAGKADPGKLLRGLTGPEPFWTFFKAYNQFKVWNIRFMQNSNRSARDLYMMFWASTTMLEPITFENRQWALPFYFAMWLAYQHRSGDAMLGLWAAAAIYGAYSVATSGFSLEPRKETPPPRMSWDEKK